MKKLLQEQLELNQFVFEQNQIEQIIQFHDLLVEWNKQINLTSIVEVDEAVEKHYLDSLQLLKTDIVLQNKMVVDLGTGAGFPGIPLAIFCPETQFVLIDSLAKRIRFLEHVVETLHLKNVCLIHARAEDIAHNPNYREQFDIVVSRAVAQLNILSEYLLPLSKIGGLVCAYKAKVETDEIEKANKAIYLLGGLHTEIIPVQFKNSILTRNLIIIPKTKNTPKQYPRKAGIPKKNPIL
ncbi:MAG: 16S rRNA (guanine(527)-N(7))-methyltransferase RsmG [Eubacteriales bacterium]|nr:16S rRNA (guanine(527)-N(7))-methyltransferase RsmG [Eubacteriales bacterium]